MPTAQRAPSKQAAPIRREGEYRDRNGPERVSEIQRTRMLAAMAEACAEHGAGNVTVAHVVGRSGVSRRTFYEIFDDREACFLAAMDEALERVASYVLPAYEAQASWLERIRAGLTALLEYICDDPLMGRLLVVETFGASRDALERRRLVLAQVTVAVDAGRAESRDGASLPPLTAEGQVGGALSVLHGRLVEADPPPPLELAGPLISMLVLPYLGSAAARRELARPVPTRSEVKRLPANPLQGVAIRLTYRTVRVLCAVAEHPQSSNREVAVAAGIGDQGQISKLLTRLRRLELIENGGAGMRRGAPNAWRLTAKGHDVHAAVS